jgi:hypothetical protein
MTGNAGYFIMYVSYHFVVVMKGREDATSEWHCKVYFMLYLCEVQVE